MNIDFMLKEIESYLPDYNEIYNFVILKTMQLIFGETIKYKNVAIVCGGRHSECLIRDFFLLLGKKDIIDEKSELIRGNSFFESTKILDYDSINNYDLLVISSYEFRNDVKQKLINKNYSGHILDIYEELNSRGIILSKEYYQYKNDPYSLLIICRKLFREENNHNRKEKIFSWIIALFVKNKDLLQAKKHLKLFLQNENKNNGTFQFVFQKIILLEKKLQEALHQRKQKDIICFWQDDLKYTTSKKMTYLNRCREKGIDFINAYGASISTRSTYGCMMERTDEIALFLHNKGTNQVAKLLTENGYKTFRIGGKGICEKLEDFDYQNIEKLGDYETPTTLLFWEALKILLSENAPVFIILHSLLETHPPFYAPTLEKYSFDYQSELFRITSPENLNTFEKNAVNAAKYLDEENEYFNSLLSNNSIKIYMSDHGCSINRESRPYKEELSHVPFVIVGNGISHLEEKRLFSLKKFYEVIKYIITLEYYEDIFEDYLQINGIDLYNNNFIQTSIDVDMAEFGIQYIGIRTSKDMYIYRATGDECYYLLPNENDNIVNNVICSKRIKYLKSLMKKEMINIAAIEKFKNSKRLYEKIGKPVKLIK